MQLIYKIFFLLTLHLPNLALSQISGVVYKDYNANGQIDNTATFNEPYISGIWVRAFNSAGLQVGTTKTTNTAGAYSFTTTEIPAGTDVRIEFSNLPSGSYSSFIGSANGTSIQFVRAPSSSVNFAINNPSDYSQINPSLATNSYVEGDAPASPLKQVLVSAPFTASGTNSIHSMEANHLQIGSTWGLAYHRKTKTLFAAAFQKRHTSFGSGNSTGVIYKVPNPADGSTAGVGIFLDLNVLYGSNVAGNNPHPNATANFTTDEASYGLAGKISLGGIDLSEDERFLWVVNLNDRQLYKIPVGPNLEAPTSTTQITRYPLFNKCDCDGNGSLDGVSDQNLRPFAVKSSGGKVYIGMVCAAYSTPSDFTKMNAYVFSFDPITTSFTQVLSFPLNYNRGSANTAVGWNLSPIPGGYGGINTANWRPWDDTYSRAELSFYDTWWREGGYPQPMLTDIEFDASGNMHIGLRDRFGDMVGDGVNEPGGSTTMLESDAVGDILRATPNGSSWTLNLTQAIHSTEFYFNDNFDSQHHETSNGGLAHQLGTSTMVNTVMDPLSNISFGLDFHNITDGSLPRSYQVYRRNSGEATIDDYFAKSNGNGDVELLSDYQPIQIGNRIWLDANENGIQDANETTPGVANGTTVTLRSPGIDGIYGNADDQTWTTTTDNRGNYYFSALSVADNRKPISWTGVGNTILEGYAYRIEVPVPNRRFVTRKDVGNNGNEHIDSDAQYEREMAVIYINTSNTNHNFDIGFSDGNSIGDRVWLDADTDGVQDANEVGVPNIKIVLYNSSVVAVDSTTTDANGYWIIKKIAPGNGYFLVFSGKANGQYWTNAHIGDVGGIKTSGYDDSNADSDVNPDGVTLQFSVTNNMVDYKIDAGLSTNNVLLNAKITKFLLKRIENTVALDYSIEDVSVGSMVIIERSINGIQFNTLNTSSPSGTIHYVYKDNSPVLTGRNFYRLKIVMPDGKIIHSEIKVVNFTIKGTSMDIYPNPASNTLNINIHNMEEIRFSTVRLINQQGQTVKELPAKTCCNSIDVSQLPSGTYTIQLWNNKSLLETKKMMIMN